MKTKRPYAVALDAANEIVRLLQPACERIEIAGSIRRKSAVVGDIELVAIQKTYLMATSLFGEQTEYSGVDERLRQLSLEPTKDGKRYKQFQWWHLPNEWQVDLFLATPENWGYILMLRTGPADFSKDMVTTQPWGKKPPTVAVRDGAVFHKGGCVEVPTEEALFALWGMAYIAPENRR